MNGVATHPSTGSGRTVPALLNSIRFRPESNGSLKRVPKPLGLTPPLTGLPKTLESGFIEILMGHVLFRRIVFPKPLFSIWVNQRLPL
jgi:hypothetical protein